MAARAFTVPLTLTSQFAFCGLPLRLDTYAGCAFQCKFCFARYRGGATAGETIRPADPASLRRTFGRALIDQKPGILAQFLRRRVPVHFGGMSDPFQPAEQRHRVTRSALEILGRFQYPTVISTRSVMIADAESPAFAPGFSLRRPVFIFELRRKPGAPFGKLELPAANGTARCG